MDVLSTRLVAGVLRLASTLLVCAGVAFFVAGIPVLSAASGAPRDILVVVLQIGGAWVLLGIAAAFLSRRRTLARAPGGVWALALGVTLLAVPAWLVWRLQPFLAEWRVVADLLASSDIWQGANANMSGVVLVPLAGALAPPFIELAALAAAAGTSIAMVVLLLTRSARFSHLYLAAVLLLAALVIGSLRGATAAGMTVEALQPWIEESKPRPEEYAQIRGAVDRYSAAVSPTATALAWAWLGYALWIPAVLLSARQR
jgi:hypothetical protein